jgi:hypothetical protein
LPVAFSAGSIENELPGSCLPAAVGGPLALVRDRDIVRIDAAGRRMDLLLGGAEIAARRAAWRPLAPRHKAGLLAKYAAQVGQANKGAVTHAGAATAVAGAKRAATPRGAGCGSPDPTREKPLHCPFA